MTSRSATEQAGLTLFSGPAGGVAGAARIARSAGYPNFLSFDMGGTSTDVALCLGGEPVLTRETKLGYFPLKSPTIDVRSVGAGGGSIAHVPEVTRALRVGPESAGAARARRRTRKAEPSRRSPTPTSCSATCPTQLLGGEMQLDASWRGRRSRKIADAFGLTVRGSGRRDRRRRQREHGRRPSARLRREGARPARLRAGRVRRCGAAARECARRAARLLPGHRSADPRGALRARRRLLPVPQRVRGDVHPPLRQRHREDVKLRLETASAAMQKRGSRARESLRHDREVRFEVDVRYQRQALEIPIPITLEQLDARDALQEIAEQFAQQHEREYGFRLDVVCEFVNLRAFALGRSTIGELPPPAAATDTGRERADRRLSRSTARASGSTAPCYDRARLAPGHRIEGPAIVVQTDSTTLVLPGSSAEVDEHLNLVISRAEATTRAGSRILADRDRHHRERAEEHPARDGCRRLPRGHVDRNPRGARLVPACSPTIVAACSQASSAGRSMSSSPSSTRSTSSSRATCSCSTTRTSAAERSSTRPTCSILRPIFFHGELVGFASQIGNLMDIGGPVPGSMPARSRSIFDEGIRFPPVKLYERGSSRSRSSTSSLATRGPPRSTWRTPSPSRRRPAPPSCAWSSYASGSASTSTGARARSCSSGRETRRRS